MNHDEIMEKHKKLNGTWGNDFYILKDIVEEVAKIRQTLNGILDLMKKPLPPTGEFRTNDSFKPTISHKDF